LRQIAVIGEQQQAFAGVVQSSHRKQAYAQIAHQMHDRGAALGVANGGDISYGLIQHHVNLAFRPVQQFAIDSDMIAFLVGFGAQLGDRLSVDRDPSRGDQFFALAPRGYACRGHDFL
jgi:hypothetical protein